MESPLTKEERLDRIHEVFSPSAPIESPELFIGRFDEVLAVQQAVGERGQHAVLYGGRGTGKTSLANIIGAVFSDLITAKVTCNRADTFTSIWRKALGKVKFVATEKTPGFNPNEKKFAIRLSLPQTDYVDASAIEEAFSGVYEPILFVFDEFDSITDDETRRNMADTIKALSDNVPNVTVLIIGIAGSVTELIGYHPSIERCIRQIEMSFMTDKDIAGIISNSLKYLNMQIDNEVAHRVMDYACGFPNYVHLLCKFTALDALSKDSNELKMEHLNQAVAQSIQNSNHSIREAFEKAISSAANRKNQFEDVLKACLNITEDGHSFTTEQVAGEFSRITERDAKNESIQYNLGMLCKNERGSILTKMGKGKETRYAFNNPMMKAFIKLQFHGLEKNE